LQDRVLGIPKQVLITVYISARKEFFEIYALVRLFLEDRDPIHNGVAKRLQQLTQIMLLFDSEHQTVVNVRYTPLPARALNLIP
jgi:hypothetical protein